MEKKGSSEISQCYRVIQYSKVSIELSIIIFKYFKKATNLRGEKAWSYYYHNISACECV